jgi:hypothetical protein
MSMNHMRNAIWGFALVLGSWSPALAAEDGSPPISFDDMAWQSAGPADLHVFDPYIGTFEGKPYTSDEGKAYHFKVSYEWYDKGQTLIKFSIRVVVPANNLDRVIGEGFYGYDPFTKRIFAHGYFPRGQAGWGWVSAFDPATHARVTRVHSQGADGVTTEVRDTFWVIDENSWGNITFVSQGGAPWQQVSDEVFTRVEN